MTEMNISLLHMINKFGHNFFVGVYDVTIDSQEGLAKVYGVVNPNMLVRALTRTGYHAELKWVKLRHPELNRRSYSHDYYDHGNYNNRYPYGLLDDPYRHRRYLMDHSYPCSSRLRFDRPYYHGSSLPPARYVPSYPPREYDPYEDEPISFCSIM